MVDQTRTAAEGVAPAGEQTPAGEQIAVSFDGGGAGTGELTWGHRELWQTMRSQQTWLPIGTVRPLPAGTTIPDAVADLAFVMSSYPSLRTRLRFDPDGPKQVVAGSGQVTLEVVEAPDDADPAQVADQVWWRDWRRDYDFATQWPVRMAVVQHRGVLTHRAWVMCHLVTDGAGASVMVQELAGRNSTGSAAAPTPLELAGWQHSPAGQRHCQAVLRRWEKVLRAAPARQFPERTQRAYPRYWQARFDSPATHLAVRRISARTGVEGSSVLLTVFAVALARVTGCNPVLVQLNASNRFRPRLANLVSPIMQAGLCAIELPDATIDQAVARTRLQAMTAYKYAYYDPYLRDELIELLSEERGEPVDIGCVFNDRRLQPRDESGPVPTPDQIRAAVSRGSFVWMHKQDRYEFNRLAVSIEDGAPDTVRAKVTTDIHQVSPQLVAAGIRGIEEVAVAAALDPAERTSAPVRQAGS